MSVVKPKPKLLFWPITTDAKSAISQSELETNTRSGRQVGATYLVTIGSLVLLLISEERGASLANNH